MLNLPYGTPVKTGIDVATVDFLALLKELLVKSFNGYLCMTIKGVGGIEEGILLFDNGKIVASFYEYFKYGKTVYGDQAFVRVMNASAAKEGVIDLYQLSNEQVQLILAFNEQAISIPTEKDYRALKLTSFSPVFEDQVKPQETKATDVEILKKYKIVEAAGEAKKEAAPKPLKTEEELQELLEK